jgi:RNA recognition motif-containing protein
MANTITKEVWLGWSAPLADQALRATLADFPGLTDLHIDENKRFAFGRFDSFENCARLLENNTLTVGEVVIKVRPKKPVDCLFIKGLPWSMTTKDVFALAGQYGTVVYCYLSSADGRSNGYAFVTLDTQAEMDAALAGLNGAQCGGRTLEAARAADRGVGHREAGNDHPRQATATPISLPRIAPGVFGNRPTAPTELSYCGKGKKRRKEVRRDDARWQ